MATVPDRAYADRLEGAAESRGTALPNLVIIGAKKCGTSALHYAIDTHPDAAMSTPKEVNFFYSDPQPVPDLGDAERGNLRFQGEAVGNWDRGADWYRRHFEPGPVVRGESSPLYTSAWSHGTAERMAGLIPDAKLIFCVRDPIERMISDYQHESLRGLETRDINRALGVPGNSYLVRSRYWSRIEPFVRAFPSGNILVVAQEDLDENPRETMAEVFNFLGIDPDYWDPRMERRWNATAQKDWRRRYLERLRAMPGMGWTYKVPREWKWKLRKLVYRDAPARPERPELLPHVQERIRSDLAEEIGRFRTWSGKSFSGWSI